MDPEEQRERNSVMQDRLKRYDVVRWSSDFVHALADIKAKQQGLQITKLSGTTRQTLVNDYASSKKRLVLLDYDGTLVGFANRPGKAGPDQEIREVLKGLGEDSRNKVAVISGRDKNTLEQWLGDLGIGLVAEHGGWVRGKGHEWHSAQPLDEDWKRTIKPMLDLYSDRTPGSSVEEKDFSLVWHYRRADPALAYVRTQELRHALVLLTEHMDVGVFEGSKILEIRKHGINKGHAAQRLLGRTHWDFVLAVGDDYTDEEMFAVMPESAYSIKVGLSVSKARFNVDSVGDLRDLLKTLTGS